MSTILAIETSCDETAAAVTDGVSVLSNVIWSQIDVHRKYGGVVPEIASRMHIEKISIIIDEALKNAAKTFNDIDAVAVTYGPGLVGALLVGISAAKSIAFARGLPLVPVNHIMGHICANYIENDIKPPFVCLVASGGHSHIILVKSHWDYEIIARTRDDAPGEAFDKIARVLGLGYPGGPVIQKHALGGNENAIPLPQVHVGNDGLDFSFSGLKTAVINYVHNLKQKNAKINEADLSASFQKSVVEVLCDHLMRAAKKCKVSTIALAGGVASNSALRSVISERAKRENLQFFCPSPEFCTDNAAMIGVAAGFLAEKKMFSDMTLNAVPDLSTFPRCP